MAKAIGWFGQITVRHSIISFTIVTLFPIQSRTIRVNSDLKTGLTSSVFQIP